VSSSRTLLDIRFVLGDLFVVLAAVFFAELCLLVYVWVSYLRKRRLGIQHEQQRTPGSWAQRLLVSLTALMLVVLLVGIATRTADNESSAPLGLSVPIAPPPLGGDEPPTQPLVIHWWVLLGLALLGLSVLLTIVMRHRRRPKAKAEHAGSEREELLAAVEASLENIDEDSDPRSAVIRAYASMERALALHGLARRPSEAPLEYLARWTSAVSLSRPPAQALTRLYEWARFSKHPVDANMKQEATAALLTIRRELGEGAG
jgi:hypothetical protein